MTIVALHGFLGCGRDWDAVRAHGPSGARWICPDLFAPTAESWEPPEVDGDVWLAGYSFGARLALRWITAEPARWRGALLLSVDPGNFQTDSDRAMRRKADAAWAVAFREEPWDRVLHRWNAQAVLAGSATPRRDESAFSRTRLAEALEKFSVADQWTDPLRLEGAFSWMAGGADGKFSALLESMRCAGFPGSFTSVAGAGHRLLHEAPEAVAAALGRLVA